MRFRNWLVLVGSILLGVVFISSGIGKLLGLSAFLLEFITLTRMPLWVSTIVTTTLPWVELILGVSLVAGVFTQVASGVCVILVTAFIFHNSWMIINGMGYKPCSCLGVLDKLFQGKLSTTGALYVDIAMLAVAGMIYFAYSGKVFNIKPWYLGRGKAADSSSPISGTELPPPAEPGTDKQSSGDS